MNTAFTTKQCRGLATAIDSQVEFETMAREAKVNAASPEGLFELRDSVAPLVEAWCGSLPMEEIARRLDAAGVCWGRYQSYSQMLAEDERCSPDNPVFETVEQTGVGPMLMPGSAIDFAGKKRQPVAPAPRLGEHTDEILGDILGLNDGEIGRLHDKGIVSGPASQ
jgi:2-methylfumaryl-CoA isomerase